MTTSPELVPAVVAQADNGRLINRGDPCPG
jgi:hypothetical protein